MIEKSLPWVLMVCSLAASVTLVQADISGIYFFLMLLPTTFAFLLGLMFWALLVAVLLEGKILPKLGRGLGLQSPVLSTQGPN